MKREILKVPHAALKSVCVKVVEFDESLRSLAADIIDTITASKRPGVGMAANQIGDLRRVFVIFDPESSNPPRVFVNPVVLSRSGKQIGIEGCLSLEPEQDCEVTRAKDISYRYQNLKGKSIRAKLSGFSARVFLHELDHLDGLSILDRNKKGGK